MKIIYILLVHTNPGQVFHLVQRLSTPQTHFVIHASRNGDTDIYQRLRSLTRGLPNVTFPQKRTGVKWGTFDIIQALLFCFDHICKLEMDFDLAYILSGQDYPLKSNIHIINRLEAFRNKQIMEYFPLPAEDRGHSQDRYFRYHFWVGRFKHLHLPPVHPPSNPVLRLGYWFTKYFLPNRSIPPELQLYGGSFWSALSSQAITYIHQFAKSPEGRKLKRFFFFNLHPAEMYLQTVLLNSPLSLTVENLNLHHVKFPPQSGHPVFFTRQDLDELISAEELFARKIDSSVDPEIIPLLDHHIDTSAS